MAEKTPDASSTDHPELFGTTDWDTLFQTMKDSAEKAGKEIPVRPSRRDPEGSHPARFYINEQIYAAATEEKEKSNSIDLHVIRVKEALELTQARFDEIKADLEAGTLQHNVGNGQDHLFKVICGQGTHSDENGPKMKGAMSEWLQENKRDYVASMHHGIFFIVFN